MHILSTADRQGILITLMGMGMAMLVSTNRLFRYALSLMTDNEFKLMTHAAIGYEDTPGRMELGCEGINDAGSLSSQQASLQLPSEL